MGEVTPMRWNRRAGHYACDCCNDRSIFRAREKRAWNAEVEEFWDGIEQDMDEIQEILRDY